MAQQDRDLSEYKEDKPEVYKEFVLRLYVGGNSNLSMQAIARVRRICDEHLAGRYELQVIDVRQQPELAQADNIVVAPTLVRRRPEPVRRISGSLAENGRVLQLLGLQPDQSQAPIP